VLLSPSVDKLRAIHFEITNKCNSRCPGCARTLKGETHPYLADKLMQWDLEEIKKVLHPDTIDDRLFTFGGVVDEPFMNTNIVDICHYIVENDGWIEIFTNGGANTKEAFSDLGKLSRESKGRLKINFSVDGTKDTNHLYRVNVIWDKVLENMTAYTKEQGHGEWQYLVFDHNEKSIEEAKKIAKQLNIPFYLRQNVRNIKPWTSYITKKIDGKLVTEKFLVKPTKKKEFEHPSLKEVKNWSEEIGTPEQELEKSKTINCLFYHEREIFIDWSGLVWPCCWFATDYHMEDRKYMKKMREELGTTWNSVKHHSLEEILSHPYYKELLYKSWTDGEKFHNPDCFKKCGDNAKRQKYQYQAEFVPGSI